MSGEKKFAASGGSKIFLGREQNITPQGTTDGRSFDLYIIR